MNYITTEKLAEIRHQFSDNPLINFIDNDRFNDLWSEVQQLNTWIVKHFQNRDIIILDDISLMMSTLFRANEASKVNIFK